MAAAARGPVAALLLGAFAARAADPQGVDPGIFHAGMFPYSVEPALDQGWGWYLVIFVGLLLSLAALLSSSLEFKRMGVAMTSERFSTAGRDVGAGLTAAVLVSQWTWAATLLFAADGAWKYGISAPYWYAAGGTVQILFFGVLAVQVKRKATHLHTFLELVRARFGTMVHLVLLPFGLLANMLVTALLMLGGAAAIKDLTGMSAVWVAFLVPFLACLVFTVSHGLRGTFHAAYLHGVVLFVLLLVFLFSGYGSSSGGPYHGTAGAVYDGLERSSLMAFFGPSQPTAEQAYPGLAALMENEGTCYTASMQNTGKSCDFKQLEERSWCCDAKPTLGEGRYCRSPTRDCLDLGHFLHYESQGCGATERCVPSYATMGSSHGLLFGLACLFGNFGRAVVDQSFWQSAVAVKPRWTLLGFVAGALAWFAVPFALASTHGLVGRALAAETGLGPRFISLAESEAGFGPGRVATELLGSGGAFLLLMQLFAAMCSTGSAEIMAVASILTYDIYFPYLFPEIKEAREGRRRVFLRSSKEVEDNGRVPVGQVNTFMENLVWQGYFTGQAFSEQELCRMAEAINGFTEDGSIATRDLFNAVNRTTAARTTEGAILLRLTRFFACCYAFLMGFLALWLQSLGFGLGWVYMSLGVVLGAAVGPVCVALLLERANGVFVACGCLTGTAAGILSWFIRAVHEHDGLSYETLGHEGPMLVGNIVSVMVGLVVALGGSLVIPDKEFRWWHLDEEILPVDDFAPPRGKQESEAKLLNQLKMAAAACLAVTLVMLVIVPLPIFGAAGVFSKGGFTAWIVILCIWAVLAALAMVLWPPFEIFGYPRASNKGGMNRKLTNGEDLLIPTSSGKDYQLDEFL